MGKYNPEHEKVLNAMLKGHPVAKASQMFGYPAYKVNGKLAVGLFDTGIIVKVGPKRVKALVGQPGIEAFTPMEGRTWKDWVLLTGNFDKHSAVFEEAVQYVLKETG